MRRTSLAGFTMMEIMITLVILAVLAGLAVPSYRRTVEEGRANEARTNLSVIHMAEKVYMNENGAAWTPGATDIASVNAALDIDLSARYYDNVTIDVGGINPMSYTATLQRNTVDGGAGSRTYTITYTQGGVDPPPFVEGGSF